MRIGEGITVDRIVTIDRDANLTELAAALWSAFANCM
jgi:hypothetical protein